MQHGGEGERLEYSLWRPSNTTMRDGNWVIVVHGLGGSRLDMVPTIELLLKNGFFVLAMDTMVSSIRMAVEMLKRAPTHLVPFWLLL